MENPRPEKVAVVAEVRERLDTSEAVVLTEYKGLSVAEMQALRRSLADVGGEYTVYKNTLVRFAVRDAGLEIEDLLTGPTALAFVGTRPDGTKGDPVGLAKALRAFAADHEKFVIKGGVLSNRRLTSEDIIELAKIAPREELLARLAGGFAAPMRQFAGLLQALPQNFAYALKALIEAGGAPGAPVDPEPAPAEPTPAPEAVAETPAPEAEAETPAPEAEAETPAPEAEAETPAPEAEAETPAPEAEAETPAPEAEAETPAPEAEAEEETPAAEAADEPAADEAASPEEG